jgi:competence CoiA-like predicted nuclease
MTKATRRDKRLVIEILSKAFDNNQSVNYIIQQDKKRLQRIRSLMSYAFEYCCLFGDVLLSENKQACALILYPDKKKVTFTTILLDIQLVLTATGFRNIQKAVSRESMINRIQPGGLKYYVWFIGVHPVHQRQGTGGRLLKEMIDHSE